MQAVKQKWSLFKWVFLLLQLVFVHCFHHCEASAP